MDLKISYKDLSEAALTGLIENHITAGADLYDGDLRVDTDRVRSLLMKGELLIIYSEELQAANIFHKDDVIGKLSSED